MIDRRGKSDGSPLFPPVFLRRSVNNQFAYKLAGNNQPKISQETPRASRVLKTVTIR
jgi:hypothetical protein